MKDNYQFFLEANINRYIGEWIAICDGEIVSHGKDVKLVLKEAEEACPRKRPLLVRVPEKETMIF